MAKKLFFTDSVKKGILRISCWVHQNLIMTQNNAADFKIGIYSANVDPGGPKGSLRLKKPKFFIVLLDLRSGVNNFY